MILGINRQIKIIKYILLMITFVSMANAGEMSDREIKNIIMNKMRLLTVAKTLAVQSGNEKFKEFLAATNYESLLKLDDMAHRISKQTPVDLNLVEQLKQAFAEIRKKFPDGEIPENDKLALGALRQMQNAEELLSRLPSAPVVSREVLIEQRVAAELKSIKELYDEFLQSAEKNNAGVLAKKIEALELESQGKINAWKFNVKELYKKVLALKDELKLEKQKGNIKGAAGLATGIAAGYALGTTRETNSQIRPTYKSSKSPTAAR